MSDSSVEEVAESPAVVTVSSHERSAQVVESSPATQTNTQQTPASQPSHAVTVQSSEHQTGQSTCEYVASDAHDEVHHALPAVYDLAANDTPEPSGESSSRSGEESSDDEELLQAREEAARAAQEAAQARLRLLEARARSSRASRASGGSSRRMQAASAPQVSELPLAEHPPTVPRADTGTRRRLFHSPPTVTPEVATPPQAPAVQQSVDVATKEVELLQKEHAKTQARLKELEKRLLDAPAVPTDAHPATLEPVHAQFQDCHSMKSMESSESYATPASDPPVIQAPPGLVAKPQTGAVRDLLSRREVGPPPAALRRGRSTSAPRAKRGSRSTTVTEVLPQVQSHSVVRDGDPPPPPPPVDTQSPKDSIPVGDGLDPSLGLVAKAASPENPDDPSSSSSSSSSTSSSSSSKGGGSSPSKGKKKKKRGKKKKKRRTSPYKVKSGEIKLGHWPTASAFPGWRRALRTAVIAASNRPDKAKPWIFEVDERTQTLDHFKASDDDPMRLLDAKLAEALSKVIRGEPARRLAIEAERLAVNYDVLSGRQILRLAYSEFEKDDMKSDHLAYSNLEHLVFKGSESSLDSFINTWDHLLLSFKQQPSESHLYSKLLVLLENVPGLADTLKYQKRLKFGHPDKTYDYLISAARDLVQHLREEKQQKELSKLYKGSLDHALPASTPEEKAKMPCFAIRDGKECPHGSACQYSHDPKIIAEARKKVKEKEKGKGKGKGKEGKGKGKGKSKGKSKTKDKNAPNKICVAFNSPQGCMRGSACTYLHERPAMAAGLMPAMAAGVIPAMVSSTVKVEELPSTQPQQATAKAAAKAAPSGRNQS